ncbi:type II toxin-antitoxin system prevent-host-death family antitoxin [Shewanella sp. 202IG2-18]|uniref:type II toxin-antitoxin system prevent-host-death family antitoxin n=1 Tax=Parashewanella hymeniacidonis TaxID=2807618 RepID=UPI0019617D77|nr:type II toxin-antitoxin system prevent-host-death family antitoxin [Parashewanella hymeniacidonis]MBM7073589.1 type II toxin-antitoxin system prevent-host-death family antitoxin [Parashewanella hymeniacidonis]
MSKKILTEMTFDITDFQDNPLKVIESAKDEPVCISVAGEPSFYCVPADLFEQKRESLTKLEQLITEGENSGDDQEWDFDKFTQIMKGFKNERLIQKRLDALNELSALDQELGLYELDVEREPEKGSSIINVLRET